MAATGPGVVVLLNSAAMIVEVTAVCYTTNDQIGLNVRHYAVTAVGGVGATQGQVATALDTIFAPLYKALLSAGAKYRGIRVRKIIPTPPAAPAFENASDGVGLVAGDLMAKQVAGVISIQTPIAGRSFRGRVYVPFPGEASNDPTAVPSAAYVTALTNLANAWAATRVVTSGANSTQLEPCVFHRTTGTDTLVTSAQARSFWGTQRRRGSFGRTNPLPF